jgi:predicted Zn-dependent protease with MMP-like domain
MVGELREAAAVLARAREIEELRDDPDLLWAEGLLALATWRIADSRAAFERLASMEESTAVLDKLALLDDLSGDHARADERLSRAKELDPAFPMPSRMASEEFLEVVREAIEFLPEQFQRPLESTEVIVEPMPADWMVDPLDPSETPPDILGLFVGTSEIEGTETQDAAFPRRIFLFQRNLERDAPAREQLVEEIRKTLFHEIGHMLGFDEEGVAQMGLE